MLFHRCSTFFSHTQRQPYHIRQFLRHITASSNIPVCSCLLVFQAQELPTLFRSIIITSKTFSSQAFFSSQGSAFYTPQQYNIFFSKSYTLNKNLVDQTTDKFNNLISIFKTQRKSMQCHVSKHLEINSAWVNRLSIVTKPRSSICKSFLLSIILFYKISCNPFYSHFDKIA